MSKDLRDQFRKETKKDPIRLAYQTIPSVTTDYIKWLEEQLSIHNVVGQSEQCCDKCGFEYYHTYKCVNTKCENCIIND